MPNYTKCPECGTLWDEHEIKLQECFSCDYPNEGEDFWVELGDEDY